MCPSPDQIGSTYCFHCVVPTELRPFIRKKTAAPRTEWISPRTKDRDAAKRTIPAHTIATRAEIDAAKLGLRSHRPTC